ncbi:MAG: hypothetical protein HY821_04165 [Acidobacteria bacterium]|nr:hypothetical protein [Acidobacteriota bacterium]
MLLGSAALSAQPAPRPIGVVVSIDASGKRITLKTDAGPELAVELLESTRFLRVAPGSQDLSSAARIALADLAAGDRILARGRPGNAPGSFSADVIVVMSQADLARKHEADRADWERRGIGGVITSIDQAARELTIRAGDAKAFRPVVLRLPANARLRRYSADSIRFSDARPCSLGDLKPGDQVKARGTPGEGGASFAVEELVSGTFRDFAAVITAIDSEHNVLQVQDLSTKAKVEARLLPETLVRRLSPAAVQALAARISGGPNPEPSAAHGLQSLIEASPAFRLAELKSGDALVISATLADDPAKLTAITVLAGVEPLLKPSSRGARSADIGSWNLDLNMGLGN